MEQHTIKHKQERLIEISLGEPDRSGKVTTYERQTVRVSDLPRLMKEHNYTPIIFVNSYREGDDFEYATGFCVDCDKNADVSQSLAFLKKKGWNFVLTTTRSHGIKGQRFRIFLPFNRSVHSSEDYKRIVRGIREKYFPESDPNVCDTGRQLYFSPPDAEQHSNWDGEDYDVDAEFLKPGEKISVPDAWTDDLLLKIDEKNHVTAHEITKKTVVHCPFHNDDTPSAFIDHSKASDNWFIFCSSCDKTYWKVKPYIPLEKRCERFFSFRSDVYEAVVVGDKFAFNNVGWKKFHFWTDSRGDLEKVTAYAYLLREKHMPALARIDYVGSMTADRSYYRYIPQEAVFTVHHAPIRERIKDNGFIEEWLNSLFGQHSVFIKRWMATYCYTNYQKLPTLLLKGERGTGKNTFAEALMAIYPSISHMWHGEDRNFTPEVQNKLLVADESVSSNEKQYRLLKQRSGQKFATVNQKFVPEYQVKNNLNIIVMSNNHTPVFVRREEMPRSEKNNQFFVWEFPRLRGALDPMISKKIEDRLGYYIRTTLKDVYDEVQKLEGCRYSIPTPITDAEKALFDANITGLETEADKFLHRMVENEEPLMLSFFEKGMFPSSFVGGHFITRGYNKSSIIKNLKERGFLTPDEPVRRMVNNKREYCYTMTQKMIDWRAEELVAGEEEDPLPEMEENGQQWASIWAVI